MATKKQKDEKANLTENYKYKGKGKMISDISSSQPLETFNVNESTIMSKKDTFSALLKENKPFILKMNGSIIFDSDINDVMLLSFEEDYFRIGYEKHTYEGLNFKFKK